MIESVEKQIGEHRYLYRPLPGRQAGTTLVKLGKVFGPAFGALFGKGLDVQADGALKEGLTTLFAALDEAAYEAVSKIFSKQTEVNRGSGFIPLDPIYDVHFAGHVEEMFDVLMWGVEAQYGPFLRAKLAQASSALAARAPAKAMTTTSSGQLGV